MPRTALHLSRLLVVLALGRGAVGFADDEPSALGAEYARVRELHREALVTIKFIQKTEGHYGESAGENEINGVMIDPNGIVMCANSSLTGSLGRRSSGRSMPTNIKVLVGDDTEGREATFTARDTELDLAWLKIKKPERKYACIDLNAEAPKLHIGDRLLTLGIMGRYFGQEALVSEGVIAGKTRKPRELYVIRGYLDTDAGLPVFTSDGRLAGFACIQAPDPDEVAGNMANLIARGRGLILPVETVAKAARRAQEMKPEEGAATSQPADKADADEPGENSDE